MTTKKTERRILFAFWLAMRIIDIAEDHGILSRLIDWMNNVRRQMRGSFIKMDDAERIEDIQRLLEKHLGEYFSFENDESGSVAPKEPEF